MKNLSETIFKLDSKIGSIPYEAYERKPKTDLWNDLVTDIRPYDDEFETVSNSQSLFMRTTKTNEIKGIPKNIVMFGWFDLLQLTEMPSNNFAWTIISKNFLNVIKKLRFTDYRLINLRIIERSQFSNVGGENPRKYEDDSAVKDLIYDDDMFYGFQVLPRVRLLTEDSDPDINKIIWREDITDVPFFFRGEKFGSGLMVNQEARDALEKAGIQGIQFKTPFTL